MKIHYMGSSFARQTACGRFVADNGLATSADLSDVTCKSCTKLVDRETAEIDRETAELIAAEDLVRAEQLASVRKLYGAEAAQLVEDGWTVDSAIDHVEGACDVYFCTHPSHEIGEAEALARVTGSVAATVTVERRDLSGELVVESVETYTRPGAHPTGCRCLTCELGETLGRCPMTTTYRVTSRSGELLGIFPAGELAAVKVLVGEHPGAVVKPIVSFTACAKHPAFEPDNCPSCGTARIVGAR